MELFDHNVLFVGQIVRASIGVNRVDFDGLDNLLIDLVRPNTASLRDFMPMEVLHINVLDRVFSPSLVHIIILAKLLSLKILAKLLFDDLCRLLLFEVESLDQMV